MAQISLRNLDRRGLLLLGAAAGAVWGGGALVRRIRETRLRYHPDPHVAGFRRVDGGAVSGGLTDPLIGLGSTPRPEETPAPDDLCTWLHLSSELPGVPVAYFWDYACPYCRPMSRALLAMEAEGLIALSWHHTPVFGPASERVARFALAADRQNAGRAALARLAGGRFAPSPEGLAVLAEALGLDGERLTADTDGRTVTTALARSRGLARAFAFPGTPALVVGRTVVVGALSEARVRAVVEGEAGQSPYTGENTCG